jgi:hypothetical protein
VQSEADALFRQPSQKLQPFLAILDRDSRQAHFVDDQFLQRGLFLHREFSGSPSGFTVLPIVFFVLPMSDESIDGPHACTAAILFPNVLANVFPGLSSFSLRDDPTPPEGSKASKRLNHVYVDQENNKVDKCKQLEVAKT